MASEMMDGFIAGKMDNSNGNGMCMPVMPAYGMPWGMGMGMGGMGMGGWGEWFPMLIIAALIFGNGNGFGFGGGFGGGAALQGLATRADINEGFALQNITGGIQNIIQGICDSTYALNNSINNGFHGVDNAICNLGYQVQQGFNTLGYQQKDCCCETQRLIERGFCDLGYGAATNTANIIQAGHCDTDRVIARLNDMEAARQAEKIEALRLENQSLRFQASQLDQNAAIRASIDAATAEIIRRTGNECPIPAYVVPNPNCCYGNPLGVGYGNWGRSNDGCGCCG